MWISSREMSEQPRAWLAFAVEITGTYDANGASSVQLTSTAHGLAAMISTAADAIELMSGHAGLVVSDGVLDEGDPVLAVR